MFGYKVVPIGNGAAMLGVPPIATNTGPPNAENVAMVVAGTPEPPFVIIKPNLGFAGDPWKNKVALNKTGLAPIAVSIPICIISINL